MKLPSVPNIVTFSDAAALAEDITAAGFTAAEHECNPKPPLISLNGCYVSAR